MQSETGCQGKIDSKPKDGGFIKERYCYFCQSPSHLIRDCPKMKVEASSKKAVGASGFSDQRIGRGGRGGYRGLGRGKSRYSEKDTFTDNSSADNIKADETESQHIASCGINVCLDCPVCKDTDVTNDDHYHEVSER